MENYFMKAAYSLSGCGKQRWQIVVKEVQQDATIAFLFFAVANSTCFG